MKNNIKICKNNKYGIVNKQAGIFIPCEYDDISLGQDDNFYFLVNINDKWGVINRFNQLLIPFEYDMVDYPKNELLSANIKDKYGLLDLNNKIIIPFEYELLINYMPYGIVAKKNNKFGFINTDNKPESEFKFDEIFINTDYPEHFYAAINKNWGVVDAKGLIIKDFIYKNPLVIR